MNEQIPPNKQPLPEQAFGLTTRVCRTCARFLPHKIRLRFHGIGGKLTLLVAGLVALSTLGTAFLVIHIMNDVLTRAMINRNSINAYAIARSAANSIQSNDQQAIENLVSQSQISQGDLASLAILDNSRHILAHNQPELVGSSLPRLAGKPIESDGQLQVSQVVRSGQTTYEFSLPIHFSGNRVGEVVFEINPHSLRNARSSARWRILFSAGLAILLGSLGTLLLTRRFTQPITQLSRGVERLKSGTSKVNVPVLADDELGELTHNFNGMAAEIAIQRESLRASSTNLEKAYHDIVRILAGTLDARDNYTYGHSARVARLSVLLGKRVGLDAQQVKELEMACLLHDIGKIRVPDNILNKKAPLDPRERFQIREHPHHGVAILALADSLHRYIPTVKSHHEWYNGQGYPEGLRGDQIPLNAQIVAIADAYDAMTTSRPYRAGLPRPAVVAEILRHRGTQFAPQMTDFFIEILQDKTDEELYGLGF